jgi:hypothetical protein
MKMICRRSEDAAPYPERASASIRGDFEIWRIHPMQEQ